MLLVQFPGATAWSGNVVRYNVSQDDGRGNDYAGLDLWTPAGSSPLTDSLIYGNTVYVGDAAASTPVGLRVDADTDGVGIYNNVFDVAADLTPVEVDQADGGLTLAGNDYWTGSADGLNLVWLGTDADTLADWRAASGQEQLGGVDTGLAVPPDLAGAGRGGTLDDADAIATRLPEYELQPGSPLIDAGVSLTALGIDPGPTDFYGSTLPQGAGFDIGVDEYVPPTPTSVAAEPVTVAPIGSAVTLAAAGPVAVGASVTLAAVVSSVGSAAGSAATGTVTFTLADGTVLGTAAVAADGSATVTTTALPAGADAVTAAYGGDATFAPATSAAASVTVNPLALSPTVAATTLPASVVAGAAARGRFTFRLTNTAATDRVGAGAGRAVRRPRGRVGTGRPWPWRPPPAG